MISLSSLAQAESLSTNLNELLTYDCARSVASVVDPSLQTGPVFSQGQLVFTSVATADTSPILIVSAGAGTYVLPLAHKGVNRIRFEMATLESSHNQMFYLSYLHDTALRSRVFEFSMGRPPLGKDELDFSLARPQRASYLEAHLEYAIWETSTSQLNAYVEGSLKKSQMDLHKFNCEHLHRKSPALAGNLKRNLDELEMMLKGPVKSEVKVTALRLPASVPKSR